MNHLDRKHGFGWRPSRFTAVVSTALLLFLSEAPAAAVSLKYDVLVDGLNPGGAYEQVPGSNVGHVNFGTVSGALNYRANGSSSHLTVLIDTIAHTAAVGFGDQYGTQTGQRAVFTVGVVENGNDFYSVDTTSVGEARFVPPQYQNQSTGHNGITYPMHLLVNEHTGFSFALIHDAANPALATISGWWISFDLTNALRIFGYNQSNDIRGDFSFHVKLRADSVPVVEPSSFALASSGLAGVLARRRRRKGQL